MEVIVPDEFLSIAIGKRGQNVRLASKLTGWQLDVKSEKQYNDIMKESFEALAALPGVGTPLADALCKKGFYSIEELSHASPEDISDIEGLDEETATTLIGAARQAFSSAHRKRRSGDKLSSSQKTSETTASDQDERL
jgi:N utilization substance protein A